MMVGWLGRWSYDVEMVVMVVVVVGERESIDCTRIDSAKDWTVPHSSSPNFEFRVPNIARGFDVATLQR